jgi:DNA-directed RNA polymerase subunit M/transcription elongation factor TFIIS
MVECPKCGNEKYLDYVGFDEEMMVEIYECRKCKEIFEYG